MDHDDRPTDNLPFSILVCCLKTINKNPDFVAFATDIAPGWPYILDANAFLSF
jgi:hypothetical protein